MFDAAAQLELRKAYWNNRRITYQAHPTDVAVPATVTLESSIHHCVVTIRWGLLASRTYYIEQLDNLVAIGAVRV